MGLITGLLTAPLAPLRGVIKLSEVLQDQADRELHGRSAARRQLEELGEARASGRISEAEEIEEQRRILERTMRRPSGQAASRAESDGPGSHDAEMR